MRCSRLTVTQAIKCHKFSLQRGWAGSHGQRSRNLGPLGNPCRDAREAPAKRDFRLYRPAGGVAWWGAAARTARRTADGADRRALEEGPRAQPSGIWSEPSHTTTSASAANTSAPGRRPDRDVGQTPHSAVALYAAHGPDTCSIYGCMSNESPVT